MPDSCVELIDMIIERRKARGLTQASLANLANLTQSVVARIESKRAVPQLDTLYRVLDALGCAIKIVPKS